MACAAHIRWSAWRDELADTAQTILTLTLPGSKAATGFHCQLPSQTLLLACMTVSNCSPGKNPSSTAAPVASALVMRPGTQVRSIFHLGVGMRRASAIERVASTVSAVPRITVESSFTGMTTMPPSAAAR